MDISYLYKKPPMYGSLALQYKIIPAAGIITPREKPKFETKRIELEIKDEIVCKETE